MPSVICPTPAPPQAGTPQMQRCGQNYLVRVPMMPDESEHQLCTLVTRTFGGTLVTPEQINGVEHAVVFLPNPRAFERFLATRGLTSEDVEVLA